MKQFIYSDVRVFLTGGIPVITDNFKKNYKPIW